MANPLDLLTFARDAWQRTQQPLKERTSVLPLGQYEDGSIGPAWPGLIMAGIDGVRNFGRMGYDSPEAIEDNARNAFDAAGLALTGGLTAAGAGMVDNALGSAGGRLAKGQAPQGIRAYHGSPHDFDRFSLDAIGTGEGAQAYGHGLYFADSEDVARSYRDKLTPGSKFALDGVELQDLVAGPKRVQDRDERLALTALKHFAQTYGWSKNKNVTDAVAETARLIRSGDIGGGYFEPKHAEILKELADRITQVGPQGRMYEVNIRANPEDFLDLDKPLAEQPRIAEIAQRLAPDVPLDARQLAAHTIYAPEFRNALKEAGIPGIRYLDGMSRGAGEGSSNYVVFDDALIDILRKYANAPTGSAIPLGMEANQDEGEAALMEVLRQYGLIQ